MNPDSSSLLQVRFATVHPRYKVTEDDFIDPNAARFLANLKNQNSSLDPIRAIPNFVSLSSPIAVPSGSTKEQLSRLIRHITGHENENVVFDFLVNNSSLLHGTLGQCVSSSEPIHLVEYILTEPEKPKPKRDNIMPHDDWIGSIDASIPLYTLTGCYDQHIRLWKHTRTTVSEETSGSSNEISCEVLIKNAHQGPVKAVVVVGFESVSESTSNSSSSSSFSISSSVRENMMIAEPDSDEPQRSSEPTSLHCFEFVSGGMDGAIKFWRGNRRSLLSSSRSKTSKGKSKFLPRYDLQLAGVLVRQSSSSSSFSSTTSSSSSSSSSSGKKADKSKSSSSPAASPVESLAVEPSLLSRLSSTSGRRLVAVGTWVGSLDVYDVSQAMRNLTFDETMSSSASNAVAAASLDMDDDEDDQMSTLSSKRRKASTNGASGDHSLSSFISLPNANERSENSSERTPMFQNCTEVDGSYHPKGDAGNQNVINPTVRFKGHSHAVRAIQWPLRDRIFTGSWDNSISSWDVVAGACLESTKTDSSVLSLSYSLPTGIIASGQTDRHVRMWNNGELISTIKNAHKEWISAVQFHPIANNLLITASYDNLIKIWDLRSVVKPLFSIRAHRDKILALSWVKDSLSEFVSGGADGMVCLHASQ